MHTDLMSSSVLQSQHIVYQGGRKMILGGGGGHHGGRWSDTISGKGLELHMKINYDKSVSI